MCVVDDGIALYRIDIWFKRRASLCDESNGNLFFIGKGVAIGKMGLDVKLIILKLI